MNKITAKTFIVSAAALTLLLGSVALADTVTGNLSTGISATNGTTVKGVVIVPPTANPSAGVYTSVQSVALRAAGASSIRYTTNGTAPTCSAGNLYAGPITVSVSQPIEALACYLDDQNINHPSTVALYLYAINIPSGVQTGGGGGGGGGPSSPVTADASQSSKGDANADARVDVLDFVSLMANWGKTGTSNVADFNSDGRVDILDFVILMANWTK